MKFVKRMFKPVIVLAALIGVGVVCFMKYAIIKARIRPLYKRIGQLNATKARLYRLVFNPYRISNGIRPSFTSKNMDGATNIAFCHELFVQSRMAKAAS